MKPFETVSQLSSVTKRDKDIFGVLVSFSHFKIELIP